MAVNLCPDYLVKEELEFEIKARGSSPADKVEDQRKQLRELLAQQVGISWNNDLDAQRELEVVQRKVHEWKAYEDDWKIDLPAGRDKARRQTQLCHILGRLKLLLANAAFEVTSQVWMKESIVYLEGLANLLASAGKSAALDKDSGTLGQENISQEAKDGPSLEYIPTTGTSAFTERNSATAGYMKLPNPLTTLFNSLPVSDGLDVKQLLEFLNRVIYIKSLAQVTEVELLRLIIPYCRGSLSERLQAVLLRKGTFDDFHKDVLEFFVPGRLLERLKVEYFYRPQGHGERLSNFIAAVKEAGRVLRLEISEADTVQVILEGLNPEERSRLALSARPNSFLELDRLCIASHSVQLSDSQRQSLEYYPSPEISHRSGQNHRPRSSGHVMNIGEPVWNRSQGRGRPVCYGCGRAGHIRRFCRNMGNNSSRPDDASKNGLTGGASS